MRFYFHIRNKSVKRIVQVFLSVFRNTPQWSCQVAHDGALMAVKTPKRIKRVRRPVFVNLDSVDMDSYICTNYVADENEHWASMQENVYHEWASCKNCHEHIDDCYC